MFRKTLLIALILAVLPAVAWAGPTWSKAYPAGGSDTFKFNPGGGTSFASSTVWRFDIPDASIDVSFHVERNGTWRTVTPSLAAADSVIRITPTMNWPVYIEADVILIKRSYGVTSVVVHGGEQ